MVVELMVLVTGSRTYTNSTFVARQLEHVRLAAQILDDWSFALVEGGATGADTCAAAWAKPQNDVIHYTVPADWEQLGKRAGPIRNAKILTEFPEVDLCLAFVDKPLIESRGTHDMVHRCLAKDIRVKLWYGEVEMDVWDALHPGSKVWSPRV